MKIKDICTKDVQHVCPSTPLTEVARKMEELDCGSILVRDSDGERLTGIVTDRDILLRCVAKRKDPATMTADQCKTPEVLYCFEDEKAEDTLRNMAENKVRRMVVLNNKRDKKLAGIVSFGDLSAACANKEICGEAMEEIHKAA